MAQPTLLTYNLKSGTREKVSKAAASLAIRMRPVSLSEYGKPILSLVASDPSRAAASPLAASFGDEMLVMAGFSEMFLNLFLQALRRAGAPYIPLKAMLTPTNSAWNSLELHRALCEERDALEKGAPHGH